MAKPISITIGHILYSRFFPIYNLLYPIFKNRQDAEEIKFLKKLVKPGDTVLDIGANIGFYTKILAKCTGKYGKVHSFEPDAMNFKHLKRNAGTAVNIVLNNKAVSDADGSLKIYKSKDLNVDHRTYAVSEYESVETIDCVSIDSYIHESFQVNLVKMDIQGYEVAALRGMKNTIKTNPDIKLLLEFWPYGLHASGSSVKELCEVLEGLCLRIKFLENGKLSEFPTDKIPEFEKWPQSKYKNIVVSH